MWWGLKSKLLIMLHCLFLKLSLNNNPSGIRVLNLYKRNIEKKRHSYVNILNKCVPFPFPLPFPHLNVATPIETTMFSSSSSLKEGNYCPFDFGSYQDTAFFFPSPLLLLARPSSGDSRAPLGQLPRAQGRGTAGQEAERHRGDPAPPPAFTSAHPRMSNTLARRAALPPKLLQWTASYTHSHFIVEKKMMPEKEWRTRVNSTFTVNQYREYRFWLCFTRSSKLTLKFRFAAVFKLPGNFWEAENPH